MTQTSHRPLKGNIYWYYIIVYFETTIEKKK